MADFRGPVAGTTAAFAKGGWRVARASGLGGVGMARVWGGLAAAAVAAVAAAACNGGDALVPGLTSVGVGLATHRIDDLVAQAGFGCSAAGGGGVPSLLLTALGLAAIALHISSNRRPRL